MPSLAVATFLRKWQQEYRDTPQYHAPNFTGIAPTSRSRIPRIILQTVASVEESLQNYGHMMETWWTLNPEYSYILFTDGDCERFLSACCTAEEITAYSLLRQGPPRADLFRAVFMREVGGIYIDQDSTLLKPLRTVIPSWATAVTATQGRSLAIPSGTVHRNPSSSSPNPSGWSFNFLAFEPGSPVWKVHVRRVVASIFEQATYVCRRDRRGCKGFYSCVQNITGSRPYLQSVLDVARQYGCAAMNDCSNSSHAQLRGVSFVEEDQLPYSHVPCHIKTGSRNLHCKRPNESHVHYVSLPAAAMWYFRDTHEGRFDGSSAPAYFHPWCAGQVAWAADAKQNERGAGAARPPSSSLRRPEFQSSAPPTPRPPPSPSPPQPVTSVFRSGLSMVFGHDGGG